MNAGIPFPAISPEIFTISAFGMEFALRWYALAYIVGILIGWWLAARALRKAALWQATTPPMTPKQLEDLVTWVILGVILGGRLGFVLFYQPAYYLSNPSEILMIWQGGMSFHGGMLGVAFAGFLFARKIVAPVLSVADIMALAAPAGLLLGRIANFINAELWGRPSDLPWAVIFPGQAAQDCGQALGELCARHPSQLYEAALEGLFLGTILIWLVWRRGAMKTPGQLTGVFLAGYGCARFFVEFFRQPDSQFISLENPLGWAVQANGYGLTMGQCLSLPMILIGVALVVWVRRRKAPA